MNKKLWEMVALNGKDDIELGGWTNSYNREKFSEVEMAEFGENVLLKLKPFLSESTVVLEIGCASGFAMYKIIPYVGQYIGTDLSYTIIQKNDEKRKRNRIENLILYNIPAHDIKALNCPKPNITIINSVCQLFDGYCYFYRLIRDIIEKMGGEGIIFLGDIMDLDTKSELVKSVEEYKRKNPTARTKESFENEVFYSRQFFYDLQGQFDIQKVEITAKFRTVENEMTKWRYDVILSLGEKNNDVDIIKNQFAIAL
jgi:SAM-dependent methyltransferase